MLSSENGGDTHCTNSAHNECGAFGQQRPVPSPGDATSNFFLPSMRDLVGISESSGPALLHPAATPAGLVALPPGDDQKRVSPTSPQQVLDMRYTRRHRISEEEETALGMIPKMRLSYDHEYIHPEWTAMEHPEGQLYFMRVIEVGPRFHGLQYT